MNREIVRLYCLKLVGAYEDFPFGAEVSVFKVMGKMFALLPIDESNVTISLKADPHESIMLREKYESIKAGYHLNKVHWNTVTVNGDVPDEHILEMIEDSYHLVVRKLPLRDQAKLKESHNPD